MPKTWDIDAIKRNLDYLLMQVIQLRDALDAGPGSYSSYMGSDEFDQIVREAGGPHCVIGDIPHRCSQCEYLVKSWMERHETRRIPAPGIQRPGRSQTHERTT